MNKIVCPECGVYFKPKRIGVMAQEWFQFDSEVYAIWSCDLIECPGCHKRVLAGFSDFGIHHYNPRFEKALEEAQQLEKKGMLYDIFEKPKPAGDD